MGKGAKAGQMFDYERFGREQSTYIADGGDGGGRHHEILQQPLDCPRHSKRRNEFPSIHRRTKSHSEVSSVPLALRRFVQHHHGLPNTLKSS